MYNITASTFSKLLLKHFQLALQLTPEIRGYQLQESYSAFVPAFYCKSGTLPATPASPGFPCQSGSPSPAMPNSVIQINILLIVTCFPLPQ
jgi:hypothetical protein